MMQGAKADSNEAIRGIILGIKKGDVATGNSYNVEFKKVRQ